MLKSVALIPLLLSLVSVPLEALQDTHESTEAKFQSDVATYREAQGPKAFAVAEDTNGVAWGWFIEADSAEAAVHGALLYCAANATNLGIQTPCQVALLGNTYLLADDSANAPADDGVESSVSPTSDPLVAAELPSALPLGEIVYSERWMEGQYFKIGSAGDIQVWASMFKKPLRAMIWVVNASESTFLFRPKDLRVTAHKAKGREELRTWGAEEYEKKVKRNQAIAAGLYAFSAAMANQPKASTTTYYGNSSGQVNARATGPGGTVYGSGTYSGTHWGTITTWPTSQDYAEANARTQAQVGAMANSLKSEFEAMASQLLRPHSLTPGTTYGGIVYFEKEKAIGYTLQIGAGGRSFEFNFSRN